ncbi:MAG: hypothetical protein M1818_007471 [Claussenomyces sp. TS43310]|nr:MAG: hypothetical protein M1818_007471 [Claussenomyces sp. TS43310]
MKSAVASLLAASSLLSSTLADTVQFQIARKRAVEAEQLWKRDTVAVGLRNERFLYTANVSVGTPPQSFILQIDTGSSDVWVPASNSTQCTGTAEGQGCPDGAFDASKSSTFIDVAEGDFNISYVDNSGSSGDYFVDTFSIGGKTLQNFTMGLALETTVNQGIMGIGYASGEAWVANEGGLPYDNLVYAMVNDSLVSTTAYSLWLDDLEAATGSILFGGIDTAKYTGTLTNIKIYPDSESGTDEIDSFVVAFTYLAASSPSGTDVLTPSDYAVPVVLDSGTTLTLLPNDLAQMVYNEVGATYDADAQVALVPCALRNVAGNLTYGFSGAVIVVPISELVFQELVDPSDNKTATFENGQAACEFGIQPALDRPILFGDTFLRSAYVVYDLANDRIGIAQTDFNSTESNVVEFPSLSAHIPSATTATELAPVTQTATQIVGQGDPTSAPANVVSATASTGATGTGRAVPGFLAATNKSAAGPGPDVFRWEGVVLVGATMIMMCAGSGVFFWL